MNGTVYSMRESSTFYAGYWNDIGTAYYYLQGPCPIQANHTFMAAFVKNKVKFSDPPSSVAPIFCEPFYSQEVNATVDLGSKLPHNIVPLAPKQPLAFEMFNASWFESALNVDSQKRLVRGQLPTKSMPDFLGRGLPNTLSLMNGAGIDRIRFVSGLAISATKHSLEDYLDPDVLGESFEVAYRILFACFMTDVLNQDFSSAQQNIGQRSVSSEAIILEYIFTLLVEILLGLASIGSLFLFYFLRSRRLNLSSDPNTVASIMALVANSHSLISVFKDFDCCITKDVEQILNHRRFKLVACDSQRIEELQSVDPQSNNPGANQVFHDEVFEQSIAKPVRPFEFHAFTSMVFIGVQAVLVVVLAVLFVKNQINGLPLPSKNRFVQNLLENYLPTAIATLIEPMWILLNRLLCMLRPLEELQGCRAPARKSIDLNYSSLPPQLVVFRAFRSRHFILAAVCTMSILANILAVAFSELFSQDWRNIFQPTTFYALFEARFRPINGSLGPRASGYYTDSKASGAFEGGVGEDQFYIAESNYTAGTLLPAWTDKKMMYLPFMAEVEIKDKSGIEYRAMTKAFGSQLECSPMVYEVNYTAETGPTSDPNYYEGSAAAEFQFQLDALPNATQRDINACRDNLVFGWARAANGTCKELEPFVLDQSNSLIISCRPRLVIGEATVTVDLAGHLLKPAENINLTTDTDDFQQYFSSDPINIIEQAHQYLLEDYTMVFHNDSFASGFFNHFMLRAKNNRLVDPNQDAPSFRDVDQVLTETYSTLFAIWLGTKMEKLLVPTKQQNVSLPGRRIRPSQWNFLSVPMFAISQAILCTYITVAFLVYLRWPGQYLARLPTSIASIITLSVSSAAVRDMEDTSCLTEKEKAHHLKALGILYGYGSYIGGDGRIHIGIENVPLVQYKRVGAGLGKTLERFLKR
ncbi:hypothetical protein CC78DRAFT_574995 [Lojkania enalia]|uniref:Uncharacterized protein n=1 Tax=Lojkania enalia TaxID=147567 RepID=A0A9P4NA44_9PLEO|nr:hypothetical protein CC78DRAFT_574995 [Didymosphaeria enalia]